MVADECPDCRGSFVWVSFTVLTSQIKSRNSRCVAICTACGNTFEYKLHLQQALSTYGSTVIAGGIIAWALPSVMVGVMAVILLASFSLTWLMPLWSLRRTNVLEELNEAEIRFQADGMYEDAARVRDELERLRSIVLSPAPRLEPPKQPDRTNSNGG